jgi:hypothetical protein
MDKFEREVRGHTPLTTNGWPIPLMAPQNRTNNVFFLLVCFPPGLAKPQGNGAVIIPAETGWSLILSYEDEQEFYQATSPGE